MPLELLGMKDLLVRIARKGHTVHIGRKRLLLLKLLGNDRNFTKSLEVKLRVVESETSQDIQKCFRYFNINLFGMIINLLSMFYLSISDFI